MISLRTWTSLFNRRAPAAYHTVKVRAPRDYFKRADVFLEDIIYTKNEQLYGLNKTFLVKLLFDNFLDHVRQGKDLYEYILHLRKTYGDVLRAFYQQTLNKNSPNPSVVPKFQWSLSSHSNKMEEGAYLTLNVRLHPREVNRMEVFFADLDWKHNVQLDMDLDELVSLLFIEFITELRHGFTEETKEEIIESILERWGER